MALDVMYSPSPLVVDGVTMWHLAPEQDPDFDPMDWVKFLGDALTYRWQQARIYDEYYRGEHRLWMGAPSQAHVVYRRLLAESRSNWAELIVDAVNERLRVVGFRWAGSGDETADLDVWDSLWQANNLDARSDEIHVEALVWGEAYAITWPDDLGNVQITAEHPTECITYAPAADRHQTSMGFKRWCDDVGFWHCNLYTPVAVYKFSSDSAQGPGGSPPYGSWSPRAVDGEPWPLPNPFGVVPMVNFPNNPRLLTGGRSELSGGAIEMMDRINETVFNRMVAAQFSAFRQKWISGMEIPRDPDTGQPVEPFRAAVDRLWMTENPDARFGEFGEASLGNYLSAAEADISHLASISRTPAYYLLPRGQMPSGEALRAADYGLVKKVQRRQRFFGEAWEQLMRTALLMSGNLAKAQDQSCETIWMDAEQKNTGQIADMLIKLAQIGTPKEALWELSGMFSPQQIARMKQQAADEELAKAQLAATFQPTPPAPAPPGQPIPGGPAPAQKPA